MNQAGRWYGFGDVSPRPVPGDETPARAFRNFVAAKGGWFEDLPDGNFKDSGTGLSTVIVVIEKRQGSGEAHGSRSRRLITLTVTCTAAVTIKRRSLSFSSVAERSRQSVICVKALIAPPTNPDKNRIAFFWQRCFVRVFAHHGYGHALTSGLSKLRFCHGLALSEHS